MILKKLSKSELKIRLIKLMDDVKVHLNEEPDVDKFLDETTSRANCNSMDLKYIPSRSSSGQSGSNWGGLGESGKSLWNGRIDHKLVSLDLSEYPEKTQIRIIEPPPGWCSRPPLTLEELFGEEKGFFNWSIAIQVQAPRPLQTFVVTPHYLIFGQYFLK